MQTKHEQPDQTHKPQEFTPAEIEGRTDALTKIRMVGPSGITTFFTPFDCVCQFHAAMDTVGSIATVPSPEVLNRRGKLIDEEVNMELLPLLEELADGNKQYTLEHRVLLLDHIVDSVYVLLGTAVELGLPFDNAFAIVHQANIAKFSRGVKKNEYGKLIKPEGWVPPNSKLFELIKHAYTMVTAIDEHQKPTGRGNGNGEEPGKNTM